VIGAVNMDQISVDLTEVAPAGAVDPDSGWIGCEIELVSRSADAPNALPNLAARSGMIVHEFLTGLNPRIPRTTSASRAPVIEVLGGIHGPPAGGGAGMPDLSRPNVAAG